MVQALGFIALSTLFSAAISFLFPAEGPRLKDLSVSASTYGNPVPQVWGTARVGGNMIWANKIKESKHKTKAGVGFYNQYTYSADFGMAFCVGPVQSLRRIWANGKLIYDATGASKSVTNGKYKFTFYSGSEDQLPDGTIATAIGIDNTPAYRGTCYIVFHTFQLADFGNQLPQIAAEIYVGPEQSTPTTDFTTDGTTALTDYQNDSLAVDGDRGYFYVYRGSTSSIIRLKSTTGVVDRIASPTTMPDNFWDTGLLTRVYGVAYDGSVIVCFGGVNNYMCIGRLDANSLQVDGRVGHSYPYPTGSFPIPPNFDSNLIPFAKNIVFDQNRWNFLTMGLFGELWNIKVDDMHNGGNAELMGKFGGAYTTRVACAAEDDAAYYLLYDLNVSGAHLTSDTLRLVKVDTSHNLFTDIDLEIHNPFPGSNDFKPLAVMRDGATNSLIVFYGSTAGGNTWARKYSIDTRSFVWETVLPGGFPFRDFQSSRLQSNQIAWVSRGRLWVLDTASGTFINRAPDINFYADNNWLTEQDLEYTNPGNDGYTLPDATGDGMQFYDGQSGNLIALSGGGQVSRIVRADYFTSAQVTLDYIVGKLLEQTGLAPDDYDLNALSSVSVRGYGFAATTDIKGIIGELQQIFLFDLIERDRKIVGALRGGDTSVETISYKALGSGDGDGNSANYWKEKRLSEADIPASVNLKYMNVDADFEQNTAISKRILAPLPTVFSRQQDNIEASIAFNPTEAKNRVNAMLYTSWAERTTHNTRFPLAYAYLEPSDLITVNMADERSYFERIDHTEFGADYSTEVDTKGQDAGAYLFDLTGDGGTGFSQTVDSPVPARPFIFNTPFLRDIDATGDGTYSIFYSSVGNMSPDGFNGATMFYSMDGQSYDILQQFTDDAAWGTVLAPVASPIRGFYALDWDNQITIYPGVDDFELDTITDDELWAGGNICVIGSEVLQFRDAVQNEDGSWTIFNLLRGRRGTEWACDTHIMGEFFVLLSTSTVNIAQEPLDTAGKSIWFKAVGTGRDIASSVVKQITYEPRDLMPYAPVHLSAAWSSADIVFSFVRRTRIGGEMADGTSIVPLSETTESYELDVYSEDGTTVITTLKADFGSTPIATPTITYSAILVALAFNHQPTSITFEVFQMGVTGRGFGAKETVAISGSPSPTTRYWGASASTSLDEAGILGLSDSDLANDYNNSVTYVCTGGKYPYYCFPQTFGTPAHVTVNGLPFSAFTVDTVSVGGYTYNVLRFDNIQHGASIPAVWA